MRMRMLRLPLFDRFVIWIFCRGTIAVFPCPVCLSVLFVVFLVFSVSCLFVLFAPSERKLSIFLLSSNFIFMVVLRLSVRLIFFFCVF